MLPLRYTYLIGALLTCIIWIIIYLYKPSLRRSLLGMSIFIPYALLFEYLWWTHDWWHPLTVTYTRVGIEDTLSAFSVGGIVIAIYPILFSKRVLKRISQKKNILGATLIVLFQILLMFLCVQILHLTSFYSTMITYVITIAILWYLRKDLINLSLISGLITGLIAIPGYLILFALTPNFIAQIWTLQNLSHVSFLGIPIEDVLFYFITPMFVAPFYWYVTNEKFVEKKS